MSDNEFTEYSDFPEVDPEKVYEAAKKYKEEREDACKKCEDADEGCVCLNDAYNELMDLLQ